MPGTQGSLRSFMSPVKGPGKLAPTLIEDLYLYDPRFSLAGNVNVLRDAPLFYPGYTNVTPLLPEGSCRHLWCAKENQAVLPALDARPKPDTKYKFAGVCRKCRNHVELEINYGINWESEPCPNATHPLHHLVHSPWREGVTRNGSQLEKSPPYTETFAFQCSSPTCSAAVSVRYKPPVLKDEHVQLLTDTALLSQRTREVIDAEPARFEGHKTPTSAEVLSDLRSYLRNSWEHREPRPIRVDNKRFALRFGQEGQACKEVLDFLNFKHDPPDYWLPPRINVDDPVPFKDPVNTFIDDVVLELSVLISQMPEDARGQSHENSNLPAADRSLFRILGAQDYDKHPSARTAVQDPSTRHICYTALGTPEDASDELVSFAYRAQIRTNPAAGPTYLTYLRQIAESRSSELLETLVATEYSAGNFDSDQLNQAYRYFSLSPNQELTDELIIGTFQSRLQDAAKHEADMRAQLKIIGQHRNSQRIKDVADDALNTYEQALAFFDADPSVLDEFIPTLYLTKTSEDPASKESARKAVKLIAQTRCSAALQSWLSTGELGETSMDIGEAYGQFGIDDRTIGEDIIESAYKMAMEDNPAQSETYTRAFNAIIADRRGGQVQATTQGGQSYPDLGRQDWPVGLENIGNTCYLNSLLQFLFTIPELRNLVLNFDDVKMELTPENVSRKKVGSRQINIGEIKRAQRFVLKLKDLFLEMIRSPYKYVEPEQELTRLTLMTSTAAENLRRRSTIGGQRPLGSINGFAVQGPVGPSTDGNRGDSNDQPMLSPSTEDKTLGDQGLEVAGKQGLGPSDSAPLFRPSDEVNTSGDDSSEVTLVSTPSVDDSVMVDGAPKGRQQGTASDKENLPPHQAARETGNSVPRDEIVVPLAESSPSRLNMQASTETTSAEGTKIESTSENLSSEPPSRPPPIPPRPVPAAQQNHTLEEYARQQDVTEVLNHVLFQLSCAIKPIAFDEEGEQVDQIKDLFYGKTKQHIMSNDKDEAKNDRFCSIIVRLFSRPHDIYAALDDYFDVEEIANKKRFLSISRLPPIFQIQIDRAGLDQRKNNHHIELKETIYLDRYLEEDTNPALMERREEAWAWKKELADLDARGKELAGDESHPDAQTTFQDARTVAMHLQDLASRGEKDLDVPPSLLTTLESLAEHTQLELQDLESRYKTLTTNINSQFADSAFRRHAYRLHAAFFHHGTASSGHYWIYIYDFRKEMWLKYNDTKVEEVKDTNEIFRRPSDVEFRQWNGPSNPYYLVYVRDEDKDKLVESVCRDMQQLPQPENNDIAMKDMPDTGNATDDGTDWVNNAQSEHSSVSVPLVLREKGVNPSGEWDRSEANTHTKW